MLAVGSLSTAVLAQRPVTVAYQQTVLEIQQNIQNGDLNRASDLLARAFKTYPGDGGLDNLSGVIEIQEGHPGKARRAFADAIRHSPKLVSAYLNLARLDMQTGEKDSALQRETLQLYEKVLTIDPHNPEAKYQLPTLLMWMGRYQASLEAIHRLDAATRVQVQPLALVCADEAALGHKEAADRAAASLVANQDLTEEDGMLIFPALRIARRADLIETIFSVIASRRPLSATGLRVWGLAQEAQGKPQLARVTLESAFSASNLSPAPLVDLARIAIAAKDYQNSLGYLAHARAIAPNDASLPYEFGLVCFEMNLMGEARKAMGEALQLAPDNPEYNFGMGTVSSFAQDPMEALPYLTKYRSLRPDDPRGTLAMGVMYFRAKDFDSAKPWLTKATTIPKTAAEARYYLGSELRQQKNYEQALQELLMSARLKPDQASVIAETGAVYLALKNFPKADAYLHRALDLDVNNYTANFGLLQLYTRTADPRREEQSRRFNAVKDNNDQQYQEALRGIEARPETEIK